MCNHGLNELSCQLLLYGNCAETMDKIVSQYYILIVGIRSTESTGSREKNTAIKLYIK